MKYRKYYCFVLIFLFTFITLMYWISAFHNNYFKLAVSCITFFLFVYITSKCIEKIILIYSALNDNKVSLLISQKRLIFIMKIMPLLSTLIYLFSTVFLFFGDTMLSLYVTILNMYILFISYQGIRQTLLYKNEAFYSIDEKEVDVSKMVIKSKTIYNEKILVLSDDKNKYYVPADEYENLIRK